MLKLKVIIYRYAGIYLAYKEELEYITSEPYWKRFMEIAADDDCDYSASDIQGILIGSWQAANGFTSHVTSYSFKRGVIPKIINRVIIIYKNLKWDIQDLFRKKNV